MNKHRQQRFAWQLPKCVHGRTFFSARQSDNEAEMLGIARLADKGPVVAAAVAAALLIAGLLCTVLVPAGALLAMFLMMTSSAVIAFVILRRGETAALKTAGISTLFLLALSFGVLDSPLEIPLLELLFWLPAALASIALARTVRLDIAVLVIVLCGLLTVIGVQIFDGNAEAWKEQLAIVMQQAAGDQNELFTSEDIDTITRLMADMRIGAMGLSVMSFAVGSLFLARFWQASLVNPGGFQQEFHALKFGQPVSIAFVVVLVAAMIMGGPFWSALAMVALFALFLQGLAVCHALVKQRGMSRGWLVGVYILLLLPPHTIVMLGALGVADNFIRLRKA